MEYINSSFEPLRKIEDLHQNDAQFIRDLIDLFELYSIPQIENFSSFEEFSSPEEIITEFFDSLERNVNKILINHKGHVCKLDLGGWFTRLLPFWIKDIVMLKRSHGTPKSEIVKSIDRNVSHNMITPNEIDPWGSLLDDLPNWYLNVIPNSIGNLTELKFLNLGGNHLTILPESMKNLKNLKEFLLGYNMFNALPDWLSDLPKLERLDVSWNPLQVVPESVIKIAEKYYANFYNDVPNKEAIVLGILDILSASRLYKLGVDQIPNGDNAHNYRVNEQGHVSHIYIWEEGVLFEFFPEQLCELVHLEELHIVENAITSLPESLPKLKKLKVLNLWRDCIDIG